MCVNREELDSAPNPCHLSHGPLVFGAIDANQHVVKQPSS